MHPVQSAVALESVTRRFESGVVALQDASLTIAPGEFVSILGPSGCGKSTVLRLLAGLDQPSAGRVQAPAKGAKDASTAFVFQDATLMPWASVFDNVWLPLRLGGISRKMAAPAIEAMLATVGLADFAQALPAELSGGMRMRASMARALVTRPQLLLLDEPFAALDEITRTRLGADLLHWWGQRRLSVVFVTHSVYEAAFLSQRVLVMSARPGRIVQQITIEEPLPRAASFRLTPSYQAICRELSLALEQAS